MISYYFFNFIKKLLIKGLKRQGGRNFLGRVCIRGIGGGNKRLYRYIDFYRRLNQFGKIVKIFKDPNRSARIALLLYVNGLCNYIIIQKNVSINNIIYSGSIYDNKIDLISNGFSLPIRYMPLFSILSNIENNPFKGSILTRASSVGSLLMKKDDKNAYLRLNSGWQIKVSLECMSSMGVISSLYNRDIIKLKAGKNRCLGNKPKVRGVAKNPCDHPHGGGNGKKSKPMIPINAWKSVFKWKHTKNTKLDNLKRRNYKTMI